MATLVLAAAGSALGGAVGGSLAGLTTMAFGKAVGATLGSAIDQRLMGVGSEPVETGRVDRFRVMGSSEGAPLPRVYGRFRVAGQVIWSSRFLETVNSETVGGKGGGGQKVREFSYSVSLAIALCEGQVHRVGRIWADGQPIEQVGLTWRLHPGSDAQLPDPLIAAIEGAEAAPAYRDTAYVVFENLDLTPFGNRIPQFNVEVFRRPTEGSTGLPRHPALDVQAVALIPGTGEYALATEPVMFEYGKGDSAFVNIHNDQGLPDLSASLDQLAADLPNAKSVSLVVSWFGNDLRCGRCSLKPAVEQNAQDGEPMHWQVSGLGRSAAKVVSKLDGRPLFGGTPADESVMQAIRDMNGRGHTVMFYPFLLMDIVAGNGLPDPWTGSPDQPPVPWRGRITLEKASARAGSADKTIAATAEVAAFFGTAQASDFDVESTTVKYLGPEEWSYRRFILHYAHLCAAAGGVAAFCIGSELRGLTQIRDGADSYPAVRALCDLAAQVRGVLGPTTKIGYAADWSEYFGHQPADGSGDVLFHLDPLWAHSDIDFVGIDNYMPLSDWRDGSGHADAGAGSIYDLAYLQHNVAGGEGYEWYYPDSAARDAQDRRQIADGAYGEDWVFRYKDLKSWWSEEHFNRLAGVKVQNSTGWKPRSKPIWFTELGCPAVDKGTNQPNVFYDPKSSESFFPHYSSGMRDDFIQHRYLQAMFAHWNDPANNPVSDLFSGRMIDMTRAHVWAWDVRPWPDFPSRVGTWVDGSNFAKGHWLNGRVNVCSLAEVVAEICDRAQLSDFDVKGLNGGLVGYLIEGLQSGRQSLQPLMLAYAFESFSKGGGILFANRSGRVGFEITPERCVRSGDEPVISSTRLPNAEAAGRLTLGFVRPDSDYAVGGAEAILSERSEPRSEHSSLSIVLSEAQANAVAARWLSEGSVARDRISFALPPSSLAITGGDIVSLRSDARTGLHRVDRMDDAGPRSVNAVRVEPAIYAAPIYREESLKGRPLVAATPVHATFLDLPLLRGDEIPHAPYVAVSKVPWAGPVAIFSASDDFGYSFNREIRRPAVLAETLTCLGAANPGRWMNTSVDVRVVSGSLQSRSETEVLNGANAAALRHGSTGDWEVIQFLRAELVGERTYRLSQLLRGQAGTDAAAPALWPPGTDFVMLDGAVKQLELSASARGLERHYRVGPSSRSYDDPSYVHSVQTFEGIGLRPYRPVHLSVRSMADGGIEFTWIRRTRIDGDSWLATDVPLGEERERYHVKISKGDEVIREFEPASQRQTYSAVQRVSDGASLPLIFEVAQVSGSFGPGPYERIEFHG